jgi:hypothetical protein
VNLIEEDLPSNLAFILREPDSPRIRRVSQTILPISTQGSSLLGLA